MATMRTKTTINRLSWSHTQWEILGSAASKHVQNPPQLSGWVTPIRTLLCSMSEYFLFLLVLYTLFLLHEESVIRPRWTWRTWFWKRFHFGWPQPLCSVATLEGWWAKLLSVGAKNCWDVWQLSNHKLRWIANWLFGIPWYLKSLSRHRHALTQ